MSIGVRQETEAAPQSAPAPQSPPEVALTAPDRSPPAARWHALADAVLEGRKLTRADALSVLAADDDEVLDLLSAAFRVRRRYFGRQVHLYYLKNAKSGLCPEDCGYCSQSAVSTAPIPRYRFASQ